jgi:hypothetical protein
MTAVKYTIVTLLVLAMLAFCVAFLPVCHGYACQY